MSTSFYVFPAVRGIQAGKEFYTVMCPLKLITEIFKEINIPLLPSKLRAQRILNKRRIPEIKKYILENPYTYVFSSITISVDGKVEFEAISEENYQIGKLKIDKNSRIIINDGQHRIGAIKQALQENPELGYETISMVVFIDLGLERSQQIFTDLNRYSVKPTPSMGEGLKIERVTTYKIKRSDKTFCVKIEPGEGKKVAIKIPYDKKLIDKVKTIPGRRWIPEKKYWEL